MVAPKGTPPAIIARLENALQKIMASADTQKQMADADQVAEFLGAKEMVSYLRAESVKWLKLARRKST